MERRIGPLRAEVVDPESAKFTAPLLLLHGLWSTPAIWRPFTGYLAHRGWLTIAPYLELPEAEPASVAAYEAAVGKLIAALPGIPVIVGHDFGAFVALRLVRSAAAVVALAPLVLPPHSPAPRALRDAGTWIDRLTRADRPLRAPRGRWRSSYPPLDNAHDEPARLIRELTLGNVDFSERAAEVATSIVTGDQDRVTPPDLASALAARIGAEVRVEPAAGHALPVDKGWEQRVSAVHRWIVHAMGKRLLALYDESLDE